MSLPRALPAALALVAFAAGALYVADAGGKRGGGFAAGSVFNETPDGASMAFRYLGERARETGGRAPAVLDQRLAPGRLPADAVLFRIRPRPPRATSEVGEEGSESDDPQPREARPGDAEPGDTPPDGPKAKVRKPGPRRASSAPLLSSAEEAWVRGGGRLVLAVASSHGPLEVRTSRAAGPPRKTFPAFPGVRSLAPPPAPRALHGPLADEAHTVFAIGASRVLSRLPLGRGEVLLLAAPEVLENGRLAHADHLRLLEALAPPSRPVAFDEWAHGLGQEGGLPRLLLEWGFGPALLTGALAFGLVLWRSRSRLGPPEEDEAEARSEAVDLVSSLAHLYDGALSRREAAAMHLEGLKRAVALRTSLSGKALEARTRALVGEGLPPLPATGEIPAVELKRRIAAVNEGHRRLHEHAHPRRRP
ncbi:MAG TPA: hypothetical protein VGB87_00940 [Vicinamibacteria bacterium]